MKNIVAGIKASGARPHVIFSSSREIYGSTHEPAEEDWAANPSNLYGESKYHGEEILTRAADAIGFPLTILRFSNIYGAAGDKPSRFIPALLQSIRTNHSLTLHDENSSVDFIHISDAVSAVRLAMASIPRTGSIRVLNIASGISIPLAYICDMARRKAGLTYRVAGSNMKNSDFYQLSTKRARAAIGFTAEVSLIPWLEQTFISQDPSL